MPSKEIIITQEVNSSSSRERQYLLNKLVPSGSTMSHGHDAVFCTVNALEGEKQKVLNKDIFAGEERLTQDSLSTTVAFSVALHLYRTRKNKKFQLCLTGSEDTLDATSLIERNCNLLLLESVMNDCSALKGVTLSQDCEAEVDRVFDFDSGHFDSVLREAISPFNPEFVRALISAGVFVNDRYSWLQRNILAKNTRNMTPLHIACEQGCLNIAELLVSEGVEVNAQNSFRETPLHMASRSGHYHITEFLVSKGAEVNAQNSFRETPLHMAIRSGHYHITEFLVSKGAFLMNYFSDDDNSANISLEEYGPEVDVNTVAYPCSKGCCPAQRRGNQVFINPSFKGLEAVYRDPWIFEIKDFISSEQCKILIDKIDGANLVRSTVSGRVSANRISHSCWVNDLEVPAIRQKLFDLTRLPDSYFEPVKLTKYDPDAMFRPHEDDMGYHCKINRVVTVLVYLNTLAHGGQTRFMGSRRDLNTGKLVCESDATDRLDVRIKPVAGKAVVHFPCFWSGYPDVRSAHESMPTPETKYIMQLWIRNGNVDMPMSGIKSGIPKRSNIPFLSSQKV